MSDFWKCPHCQNILEKTDQLKLMSEAKRVNAVFFVNVTTRAYPCRYCGQTVDIGDVANGKFDVGDTTVAVDTQSESKPMNPVAAFLVGGLIGLVASGVLNVIWHLVSGADLPRLVVIIIIGSGAVGCTIMALSERK